MRPPQAVAAITAANDTVITEAERERERQLAAVKIAQARLESLESLPTADSSRRACALKTLCRVHKSARHGKNDAQSLQGLANTMLVVAFAGGTHPSPPLHSRAHPPHMKNPL